MSRKPLKQQVEREIDENLRRAYQRILEQEVPDRFLELLDRLKDQEQGPEPSK
ncbi:NepR family anti-sigma factor [Yoonia sp. BS5-3]|uniref:NepR family anti-sigma factor n=1 Tax=Yoonia phaeophyticola TaxID=3137369 RepID=A0ABZ2VAW5_9RHOB